MEPPDATRGTTQLRITYSDAGNTYREPSVVAVRATTRAARKIGYKRRRMRQRTSRPVFKSAGVRRAEQKIDFEINRSCLATTCGCLRSRKKKALK